MLYISNAIRSVFILTIFSSIASGTTSSENPDLAEQTIEVIRNCMSPSSVPWPNEWKREYLETIRSVVESHRDVTHFDLRLEILRNGFGPYWVSFKKTTEKSLFEVHRARTRWYVEYLMSTEFPTEEVNTARFFHGFKNKAEFGCGLPHKLCY
jgi:hypothetical protein